MNISKMSGATKKMGRCVLAAFAFGLAATGAGAQNAMTQPYLLTFLACNPSIGCNPRNQTSYLAQSGDGVSWSLVSAFVPWAGFSVPTAVRRGNTLYVYAISSASSARLLRYRMDTGIWDTAQNIRLTDTQGYGGLVDPAALLDEGGRITLFYTSALPSVNYDPANCPPPATTCTQHFRKATEVVGSDGTEFVAAADDVVTVGLSPGGPTGAADPFVFYDGRQYNFLSPRANTSGNFWQTLNLYTAPALSGPYTLSTRLPGGVLVDNPGGIGSGFYNAARKEYWIYTHVAEPTNRIYRAVASSLNQPIPFSAFNAVASGSGLGLGGQISLQHPGISRNWSGTPTLTASLQPRSVSVAVGGTATALVSLNNTDIVTAADCHVALKSSIPASLAYQAVDAESGAATAPANTPVPVAGPGGSQAFRIFITPTAAVPAQEIEFVIGCASATNAATVSGTNTLWLTTEADLRPAQTDCLFDWAEKTYADLFQPAGAASQSAEPYRYRYYARTNAYLGAAQTDRHLYYLGPLSGNTILDVGALSGWFAKAGCP